MNPYYPVYLDLRGRRCVVLGGGAVAEEKVEGLLAAGARVRVIAPRLSLALEVLATAGEIEYIARPYRPGDLDDAFIAFSERLGRETHAAIWAEAEERTVPINVQDETKFCSFIAAALVRQGDLLLTVSTGGKAPALAVRIKEELQERLGPHYARFLELAGRLRAPLLERYPDFETRRSLWYRLVDSEVLTLLEQGQDARAVERMAEIMGVFPTEEDVAA